MDIPLTGNVHCTDGTAGQAITTISDPETKKVTHFVVAEKKSPYIKRLVPVQLIKKITAQSILLSCTLKELSTIEQLEKFVINPLDGYVSHLVAKTTPV